MDSYPIKVFVVDDDEALRSSLVCLISGEYEVVGSAASAEETLHGEVVGVADVLLTDLSMPGMNGVELITQCRRRWPHLRCLILSANDEPWAVRRALKAGAQGYLLKGDPYEVVRAIQTVHAGKQYVGMASCAQVG